jgi:hypothetical protein
MRYVRAKPRPEPGAAIPHERFPSRNLILNISDSGVRLPVSTQSDYFNGAIAHVKRFAFGHHLLLSLREQQMGK